MITRERHIGYFRQLPGGGKAINRGRFLARLKKRRRRIGDYAASEIVTADSEEITADSELISVDQDDE